MKQTFKYKIFMKVMFKFKKLSNKPHIDKLDSHELKLLENILYTERIMYMIC